MKKILILAALVTAALAVSCQQEVAVETPENGAAIMEFTLEFPESDTKFAVSSAGVVGWEAGDEIVIHGKHNTEGEYTTVTLASSDISNNGKTAKIAFSEADCAPYDRSADGISSTYYFAFPASAVGNDYSCYYYNKFKNTNAPLIAGYNDGNVFKLFKLTSVIAFQASGDFDNYVFEANNGEVVGYETYQVKLTGGDEGELNFKHTLGSSLSKISGEIHSGLNFIHIPAPTGSVSLSGGFTIKFFDGDELVKTATSVAPLEMERGQMVNLGDITSHLKNYEAPTTSDHKSDIPISSATDLSASGTANCYIISAAGIYKFPAVKGNSNESAGNVFGAELVWETWNNADAVEQNSIIEAVDFQDNWIYFKVPATFKPGNAVIAAKNNMDKIIWSWHIWVPITTPSNADYGLGATMMNLNLGALTPASEGTTVSEYNAGLRYQWGRKDPFPGPSAMNSEASATLAGTQITVVHDDGAGPGSIALAIANPTVVYSSNSGDWCAASDDALWGTGKTIYDPCPVGYKVPTVGQLPNFFVGDLSAIEGWAADFDNMYFTIGSPKAVFPLCGYYDDYHSKFDITHAYDRVAYFSATGDGKTCKAVDVRTDRQKLASPGKSRAGYVRCIVEPAAE